MTHLPKPHDLSIRAGGAITQADDPGDPDDGISWGGAVDLTAQSADMATVFDITLTNPDNQFNSLGVPASLSLLGSVISLADSGGIDLMGTVDGDLVTSAARFAPMTN